MKTQLFTFLKKKPLLFRYLSVFFVIASLSQSFAQWVQPLGINGATGGLQVTSSGGSMAGNNAYFGSAYFGTNDVAQAANNGWISSTFNAIGPGFRFKASAGKPVTITINIAINSYGEITNFASLPGGIGKNEQNYAYDALVNIPFTNFSNDPRVYTYTGTFTFTNARSEAWLVFGFEILQNGSLQQFTMVLPFMVDGIKEPLVNLEMANPTTPRVITQPMLPITVLHAPPGDQSYCTFEASKTVCQTTETSISEGLSNSGNGSVKLGFKGSIGFVATIDIEAYVELTGSGTEGNSTVKIKNNETCVTSTNSFGVNAGLGEDVFLCAGQDFNYGIYEQLYFDPPSNYSSVAKKGLVLVEAGPERLNLFTESNILEQIETFKLDTSNTTLPLKQRIEAKNQMKIWKKIIAMNEANVANAGIVNPSFIDPINFPGGAFRDRVTSVNTSETNTLVVDNYMEANAGLQAVLNIGGSGISGGYNMQTTKSYGQTSSATNSNSTTISIHMQDDDADPDQGGPQVGDIFNINIYRDPMYGTPIFKLQNGTRTSCPYEGGIQIDKPNVNHSGAEAALDSIDLVQPVVALNTAALFTLQICNESIYPRSYKLGMGQGNLNGATIKAGSNNITSDPYTESFAAGQCKNILVSVSREFDNLPLFFPNLEFTLTPSCVEEGEISSSVFANVSFGTQQPFVSIVDGNWGEPNTWIYKRAPKNTDDVVIDTNHDVIVPSGTMRAKSVKLKPSATLTVKPQASVLVGN
jgi:hypothetical protein